MKPSGKRDRHTLKVPNDCYKKLKKKMGKKVPNHSKGQLRDNAAEI